MAAVGRDIEGFKEFGKAGAEVFSVGGGIGYKEVKYVGVKNACVVGEEAEEEPDEINLALMVGIARVFEGVAQVRHEFGGFEVDGGFFGKGMLFVAGDECEVLDVAMKFLERKIGDEAFGGFEVVELDAGKVGDDDVLGQFGVAAFADQVLDIVEGLPFGFCQVPPGGFVLGEETAFPEEINPVVGSFDGADGFLETGDGPAAEAEHVEKGVPKGFGFGGFSCFAGPFAGEGKCAGLDFIPTQRHVAQNSKLPGLCIGLETMA